MNIEDVSTKQDRIAKNAKRMPGVSFTSLAYHIDLVWLMNAMGKVRKDGAVGVDRMTAHEYDQGRDKRLESLLDRFKTGAYKAPPVRRVHIPKGTGTKETRPLGIRTYEDKILQTAVKMALEPLFEQDFLDCSYGFRPGRSQHDALEAIWKGTMEMREGCWLIDLDIKKYFDTIDHGLLREVLSHRVRDGVLLRVINKWLKAGVMEKGNVSFPEKGTPQGGVLSPLLSNVFLHEVIDVWFHKEVKPRLKGKSFEIRYADDVLLGFERKEDAVRVLEVLPKRLARYGLAMNMEKTKLVPFTKPKDGDRRGSATFNFLGFTHYWGRSRKNNWVVKRKTAKDRLNRALKRMNEWLKENRHMRTRNQWAALCTKLMGHYAYYGITFNMRSVAQYHYRVIHLWFKWLNRRSRNRCMNWEKFKRKILANFQLPLPRIVHSYS